MDSAVKPFPEDAVPLLQESGDSPLAWRPLFQQGCRFDSSVFKEVMLNLIKNPNINSSWLFRADILYDSDGATVGASSQKPDGAPGSPYFQGWTCTRDMIRKLIPRNPRRDAPLDQSCIFYQNAESSYGIVQTMVVYLPHVRSASEMPFYHPEVKGIAFLHRWSPAECSGTVSIHFQYFDGNSESKSSSRLGRVAFHLVSVLHKHGEGRLDGYTKRVLHDQLVPQPIFQDRYTKLKGKYAKRLIENWRESTDPEKHVFEDLGIAAFVIELWAELYKQSPFPGFVDIGCGNGLLVHILNEEGYGGWGFDARTRKSWEMYNSKLTSSPTGIGNITGEGAVDGTEDSLHQLVLVPTVVRDTTSSLNDEDLPAIKIHDGIFPPNTFIISNHADQLTPWTPIIAAQSSCPFIMIPCCSHNLTGAKFRAPPSKTDGESASTYASLVAWVSNIAADCGWHVERETLRIPSTRNAAIIGRRRTNSDSSELDISKVVGKYGGATGYYERAAVLLKTAPPSH